MVYYKIGTDKHGREEFLLNIDEFWFYATLISANYNSSHEPVLSDFSLGKSDLIVKKALS